MIGLIDKLAIIKFKIKGVSNRKAEELLSIDRKTIAKYWNEYQKLESKVTNSDADEALNIQEKICEKPKYNTIGMYSSTENSHYFN